MASHYLTEKFVQEGLTYDDVLMAPSYSEVLPRDVDISTQFTKKIIPIIFLEHKLELNIE